MTGLTHLKTYNNEEIELHEQECVWPQIKSQGLIDKIDKGDIEQLVKNGADDQDKKYQSFDQILPDKIKGVEIIEDMNEVLEDVKTYTCFDDETDGFGGLRCLGETIIPDNAGNSEDRDD